MCWPELVGGVQVEERRPRTWNEPRRKRLNFVRGQRRDSNEWVVNEPARKLIERERWDRDRQRAQMRARDSFLYPLVNGITIMRWSRKYLESTRDEAKFLAFLSLYGSNGVPLRELIELARLRDSGKPSENHWQLCGEVGPMVRPVGDVSLPTHCSFLKAFVRETSKHQGVDELQKRLLSLGLIVVEYPMGRSSPAKDDWRTDQRIWRVAENQISSHLMIPKWDALDGGGIIMDLLHVFLEMPCKDVSLLAERQRETFYNHARLFALEALRFNQTILKDAREYIVALVLQLLTHRSQHGDERLILFAKTWPSITNGSDWVIMLLWAEAKRNLASGGSRIENALKNRIKKLLSWKGRRQRRANGLIGYLLVEWMNVAEASQDEGMTIQIVKFAMDWVETAWSSGSSIERAALCSVLAKFRMLDRSVLVSPKNHLLYGHHLSRAGHLEQANEFLTSGILFYSSTLLFTRLWEYKFELVSVLIRLGRPQEAEKWLTDIEKKTMSPNREHTSYRDGDEEELGFRNRLPEHAEARNLLGLYQAELLMAAGEVSLAASQLESTIDTICPRDMNIRRKSIIEDCYLRSLRLALEIRLLEVQTWDETPETALDVAKALVAECRDTSLLEQDTVQWIVQQLLTLGNRLVWVGNVLAASSLLESIVQICRSQRHSDSLEGLLKYAEQRGATVSDLLVTDHARKDRNTLGHESKPTTTEPSENFDGPSNKGASLSMSAMSDSADLIQRAPLNDARAAANNTLQSDPWSYLNMKSSGTENKIRSNARESLNSLESIEQREASKPATSVPTEEAPLRKLSRRKIPEKPPASKQMVKEGLRRSLATTLRRLPHAPTAEPGISVIDAQEEEHAPISTGPPTIEMVVHSRRRENHGPLRQLRNESPTEGLGSKFPAFDALSNRVVRYYLSKAVIIKIAGDKATLICLFQPWWGQDLQARLQEPKSTTKGL